MVNNSKCRVLERYYSRSVNAHGKLSKKTQLWSKYVEYLNNFFYYADADVENEKQLMRYLPKNVHGIFDVYKAESEYANFEKKLQGVAKNLFCGVINTERCIALASMFVYFCDLNLNEKVFPDKALNTFFCKSNEKSFGQLFLGCGLDTYGGVIETLCLLVNLGFDLTKDFEYAIIKGGANKYIEIATSNESYNLPYKNIVLEPEKLSRKLQQASKNSNYKLWDISPQIDDLRTKVADVVLNFWGVERELGNAGLFQSNLTVFENFAKFCEQKVAKNISDVKNPVIIVGRHYVSVNKLFELVMSKNNYKYSQKTDLLDPTIVYFKIDCEDVHIKFNTSTMFDENFVMCPINDFVSGLNSGKEESFAQNSSKLTLENLNDKFDDFVPGDNAQYLKQTSGNGEINANDNLKQDNINEVVLEMFERQAKKEMEEKQNSNFEYETLSEDFENTTKVSKGLAEKEMAELLSSQDNEPNVSSVNQTSNNELDKPSNNSVFFESQQNNHDYINFDDVDLDELLFTQDEQSENSNNVQKDESIVDLLGDNKANAQTEVGNLSNPTLENASAGEADNQTSNNVSQENKFDSMGIFSVSGRAEHKQEQTKPKKFDAFKDYDEFAPYNLSEPDDDEVYDVDYDDWFNDIGGDGYIEIKDISGNVVLSQDIDSIARDVLNGTYEHNDILPLTMPGDIMGHISIPSIRKRCDELYKEHQNQKSPTPNEELVDENDLWMFADEMKKPSSTTQPQSTTMENENLTHKVDFVDCSVVKDNAIISTAHNAKDDDQKSKIEEQNQNSKVENPNSNLSDPNLKTLEPQNTVSSSDVSNAPLIVDANVINDGENGQKHSQSINTIQNESNIQTARQTTNIPQLPKLPKKPKKD